jgi:hypothetical protein
VLSEKLLEDICGAANERRNKTKIVRKKCESTVILTTKRIKKKRKKKKNNQKTTKKQNTGCVDIVTPGGLKDWDETRELGF